MLTRCPDCGTRFRVTPEQLKARAGRVRCGECQHVFNALDSLIEAPVPAAAQLASDSRQPPLASPEPDPVVTAEATPLVAAAPAVASAWAVEATPAVAADQAAALPAPTSDRVPRAQRRDFPEPAVTEKALASEPVEAPGAGITTTDADIGDGDNAFPESPRPPRRWPWAIASLAALVALAAQAALAFRVELAVLSPEAKPALVALCEIADCEVGLPAKVALVGIEGSDLYPDSGHAGRLSLTATLKNRAPYAQQFPHLELTLTDVADKAVARKVMKPQDYLPPKTSAAEGMPPNADIAVIVAVDPGEIKASGYRLYLFYP